MKSIFSATCLLLNFLAGSALAAPYAYQTIDIPGATQTFVSGINNAGDIVLNGGMLPFFSAGYFKAGSSSSFEVITGPSGETTTPYGLNDNGQIVGGFNSAGFVKTGSTYQTIAIPGASLTYATDINNNGDVLGYAFTGGTAIQSFVIVGGTLTM